MDGRRLWQWQTATPTTGNGRPWQGIYAGIANQKWVPVFAWDAFGLDATGTIADDSTFAIGTIGLQ